VTLSYAAVPDWSALATLTDPAAIATAAQPSLDSTKTFTSSTTYDALNRPTSMTTPDASVVVPTYNETNLLETVRTASLTHLEHGKWFAPKNRGR
jgi:YD repeat-containing protein